MADFVVSLTKKGREMEAQQLKYGYGFTVNYFELGSGGHDPGNPTLALPLNTDVTELPQQFFGPEPIDLVTLVTTTCLEFTCVVQPGQAVGGISNLGLVATMLYNGVSVRVTPDVSTQAIQHFIQTINGVNYDFLSSATPTASEVVTGLIALINADSLCPVTGSGTDILTLTPKILGAPFTHTESSNLIADPPETFLYGLTNFPLRYKASVSKETFNVTIKT